MNYTIEKKKNGDFKVISTSYNISVNYIYIDRV